MNVKGWVCNSTDGVHIRCTLESKKPDEFYSICIKEKPQLALISDSSIIAMPDEYFADFEIIDSQDTNLELIMTPDFALCADCRRELHTTSDKRHQYPFITCTHCGPRYSILTGLPYDRPLTTMSSFSMCESCKDEYNDPMDRRYYSQTNSCSECGIQVSLYDSVGRKLDENDPLGFINDKLNENKIVAVKGIGGFLLLCDAESKMVIKALRQRKQRPDKPFAVLFPDIKSLRDQLEVRPEELELLESHVSPIVLISARSDTDLPLEFIAPGMSRIGAMIPYAPILELIASRFERPLIATSANLSGAPIVHDHDISRLFDLADFVVDHNRPIAFPQDDSVMQLTPFRKQQIIIRQSRGLAPNVFLKKGLGRKNAMAMGAEMKASFGLSVNSNIYLSQYLGSLDNYDNQLQYENVLDRYLELINPGIEEIIIDAHSDYFTHQLGKDIALKKGIPTLEVQHHQAHFAAILSEQNLIHDDNVLGVVWDGTGLGSDGQIWGGEFFEYSSSTISRIAHLAYFSNLAQEKMAKDNRLCALSLVGAESRGLLQPHFTDAEWTYYLKALSQKDILTSSLGRVFDAVAFLTGLNSENSYEGQSAMLVEQDARKVITETTDLESYEFGFDGTQISLEQTFQGIIQDLENNVNVVAARFHLTLVEMIRVVAEAGNYEKIVFSGGVFLNGLLVDLIQEKLRNDFQLFFHQELSPNDENISYGQLAYAQILANKKEQLKHLESCV